MLDDERYEPCVKVCVHMHIWSRNGFCLLFKTNLWQSCTEMSLHPHYLESTQRPDYGNTALTFQWSNAEGIALSMKSRCYVICFQHLLSAVFRLYSTVIYLPLSPIQATLQSKSLLQWTALGHRSRGLTFKLKVHQRATLQAIMFIFFWHF